MINPFEEVEPLEPLDPFRTMTAQLSRAMLWDMVGPSNMQNKSVILGQHPASQDVLEAEANEMWARKRSLLPFGQDFPLLCYVAAEAASTAILTGDDNLGSMSESDKTLFREGNIKLGTAVAESVVSHMLTTGLIRYGEHQ